jgi:hypothetical protein
MNVPIVTLLPIVHSLLVTDCSYSKFMGKEIGLIGGIETLRAKFPHWKPLWTFSKGGDYEFYRNQIVEIALKKGIKEKDIYYFDDKTNIWHHFSDSPYKNFDLENHIISK